MAPNQFEVHVQKAKLQAYVCWFGGVAAILALLVAFLGAPVSPEGLGEVIGRAMAHSGIAAGAVWLSARGKSPPWSWGKFLALYLLAMLAILLATRAHAAEPDWPFAANFPFGWKVERLQGVSSAPEDQTLGVREIGRSGEAVGSPTIGISCAWREHSDSDVDEYVRSVSRALEARIVAEGGHATIARLPQTKIGGYSAQLTETRIFADKELLLVVRSAYALTDRCLLIATLASFPEDLDRVGPLFDDVVHNIKP